MRVLVTGGFGCIGSWIAKRLIDRGLPVWIYDLHEDPRRMHQVMDEEQCRQVRFVQGDVTDLAALQRALDLHGITHVVHLAGLQVPTCRADPLRGAVVNVVGTLAVFEAVRRAQPNVQRLTYASSAAVFGEPASYLGTSPLADEVPLHPSTHYGVFKCCNEGNARVYHQDHGLASIGLRPWTVYGVGRDFGMTSEPTKAIKSVAIGRPYRISYGGWQDMQFAADVADAFIRCLEVPQVGAKVYNLRGAVVSLAEFHQALCDVAPEAAALVTHGERQLPIAYDLSDDALQHDVGPLPRTDLRAGIEQTLRRFQHLARHNRLDVSDL